MWDTKLKMLTAVRWDQVPHLTENSGSHLPVISKKMVTFQASFLLGNISPNHDPLSQTYRGNLGGCGNPGGTPLALLESTGMATLKAEPLTFPAASDGAVLWLLLNGKRAMGRWKQDALHHILGFLVQIVQLEVDIKKSSESKANPIHWKETNMCFIYG